jgi:hypothetical protein
VLGAGEVFQRQARTVPRQIGPLPKIGVGEVAADQAALLLVQAREEGERTSAGVIGRGRHAIPSQAPWLPSTCLGSRLMRDDPLCFVHSVP